MTLRAVPNGLDLLTSQLWAGPVGEGWARVLVEAAGRRGRPPEGGWLDVETYWAVPSPSRLRLLVPADSPRLTAAALGHYRGLRRPREATVRSGLAALARAGLPAGAARVRLQVRESHRDQAAARLPLAVLGQALGGRLVASIGVRPGVNGKPTLHLLDERARPAGFAKLGWNDHTDEYVRTETRVLTELAGGSALVRTPEVLAEGRLEGHPWVVTQPLPPDVRALRGRAPALTPAEVLSLAPVTRSGPVASTGQWRRLRDALAAVDPGLLGPARGPLDRLLSLVAATAGAVPVAARWHGDLTPWNCARDGGGRPWTWDWETSEADVVAGLDALHWAYSVRRERAGGPAGIRLDDCLRDAEPVLRQARVAPEARPVLAGVYAATVAGRAAGLAARAGWERSWIGPGELASLADQACALAQRVQSS